MALKSILLWLVEAIESYSKISGRIDQKSHNSWSAKLFSLKLLPNTN